MDLNVGIFKSIVLLWLVGFIQTYRSSKRADIEKQLYKNVIPYIKIVREDAEKARKEIKRKKITKKHVNKSMLLSELDTKVLPWLDELTGGHKRRAKELKEQYQKIPHNIHGPSALKSVQIDRGSAEKSSEDKLEKTLTHNTDDIKQEQAGQYKQINALETISKKKENEPEEEGQQDLQVDKDIESEVAQITNQIAEFQESINHLTDNIIFPNMETEQKQHSVNEPKFQFNVPETKPVTQLKPDELETKEVENKVKETKQVHNKDETGNTEKEKENGRNTSHHEDGVKNMGDSDFELPEMSGNNEDIPQVPQSMFEPKSSLFSKKLDTFPPKEKTKNARDSNSSVKIIFGGNVGFDGIVRYKVEAGICTYNESFDKIRKFLGRANHVVVSLDSPFQNGNDTAEALDRKMMVKSLSYAGIDTVVLANNHILDYGPEVSQYTALTLRKSNTLYSGFTFGSTSNTKQEPVIYATNGVTIGLLSYCMNYQGCAKARNNTEVGPAIYHQETVKEEVTALRESGIDVVNIYLHWGEEDDLMPSFGIKEVIRNLSSVKIDVIVGSHPHVDGHYYYRGTLVVLTLGTLLTPMHLRIYKSHSGKSQSSKFMERLWDKQNERWEMPSTNSKLLQIEVNRDGLIPYTAKYLSIRMGMDKNHCLQPERLPSEWWITICSRRDKQCLGSSKCNELECNGIANP